MSGPAETVLARLAAAPRLLVACDFDGTLAEIVPDPAQARADRRAIRALAHLAAMPGVTAAVVSGRALDSLSAVCPQPPAVRFIGSHGAEYGGPMAPLSPQAAALLFRLDESLRALAAEHHGVALERKPAGFALHYRAVTEAEGDAVVAAALSGPGAEPGVHVRHGKKVVELSVVAASKAGAMERLRRESGADAALFLGDDLTDEDVFVALGPGDLGVKIGEGRSAATHRVEGPAQVADMLEALRAMRTRALGERAPCPIERLSLLSDQRTAALVTPSGRIVWLCLPRIDSGAIFAELLGPSKAPGGVAGESGHFSVAPAQGGDPVSQGYVGDTWILMTAWASMTVTDYFDCSAGRAFQRTGRSDLIRVIEGEGAARVEFAPRPDFARAPVALRVRAEGLEVEGGSDPLVLCSPGVRWEVSREGAADSATALVDLSAGPVVLELRSGTASLRPSLVSEASRRQETSRFWSAWAGSLRLPSVAAEAVKRGALVIKALTHGPTGAIAAAATTSLPEHIGGARNWDYRYCWPRDAAMAAAALLRVGNMGAGMRFLDFMAQTVSGAEAERLRPLYTVAGESAGNEGEISTLSGYAESRPVRIGNAAAAQLQLDVFGPIVDLAAMLAERGAPITPEHRRLVESMVRAVEMRWREPDHGVWEVRAQRRHYTHSKILCWLCADRAARLAPHLTGDDRPEWAALAEAIRDDVLANGYSEAIGAFRAWYGADEIDAATLHAGLSGLVAPNDPRFVGTVEAVERELRHGPTVDRYRFDDGLPGREGGFHICTFWLVEALALIGRREDARELFEGACILAGPTGLLSEQYDPEAGLALGNHPQVYSHLGVINAACALAKA